LVQNDGLKAEEKLAEAAHRYAEAIKEMKAKAAHPDADLSERDRLSGADQLNLGLVARCQKLRGQCLATLGKIAGKRDPKLAGNFFLQADACFQNAEDTLEKTSFTGWDGETAKRIEMCDIYFDHAQSLDATNDWSQALVVRDKANTLCVAPNDLKMIRNLVDLATDCQNERRGDRAEGLIKEAIRRYQKIDMTGSLDYQHALQRLGDCYALQLRSKEALSFYEQAVAIMKKYPKFWNTIKYDDLRLTTAVTYVRLGRDADAEPLLKQMLEYEPKRKEALELLVSVLTKEHKAAEAAHYADQIKAM
jgi:tetratricopeptide (TPR) repeat protein